MKKTLNVNIGSVAFVIDEDAYYILRKYLDDVGERFEPVEAAETLNDLEMRIADIFSENLASPRQVVNADLVRKAIAILGRADEFGEPRRRPEGRQAQADIKCLRRSQQQGNRRRMRRTGGLFRHRRSGRTPADVPAHLLRRYQPVGLYHPVDSDTFRGVKYAVPAGTDAVCSRGGNNVYKHKSQENGNHQRQ